MVKLTEVDKPSTMEYARGYEDGRNGSERDGKMNLESWYSAGFANGQSDRITEEAQIAA